ncbi:MAG: hypothetical protein U0133_15540 [Gemmatimonadales bacterium]
MGLGLAGLYLISRGSYTPGFILLLVGGLLLYLASGPAYQDRERIVMDDHGLTDLAVKLGPVPWTDIVGAEVMLVGKTPLVSVEVRNPEEWERKVPLGLAKLQRLSPDLKLSPVMLFAPRLTLSPEEIVREINNRAQARR